MNQKEGTRNKVQLSPKPLACVHQLCLIFKINPTTKNQEFIYTGLLKMFRFNFHSPVLPLL